MNNILVHSNSQDTILISNDLKISYLLLREFNHNIRKKIVTLLLNKPYIVTDIYLKLKIEQSVASQHLAALRNIKILLSRREGKYVNYSVDSDKLRKLLNYSDLLFNLVKNNDDDNAKASESDPNNNILKNINLDHTIELLNIIVHPLRTKIIKYLDMNRESTVNDLSENLNLAQSVSSQHLSLLRKFNYVRTKKSGKKRIYSVNYDLLLNIIQHSSEFSTCW
jgi:DNA-binding transcriptional ArsR family regulator